MSDLDEKIKAFYGSKSLSAEQIERITAQSPQKKHWFMLIPQPLKYAAVFIFLLGVIYSAVFLPMQRQNAVLKGYAAEVAFNHTKNLPVEIKTSNVAELNSKLDKLNFNITLPQRVTDNRKLKGGRYCSVDDKIAAQLKLEGANGETVTCYVFKNDEKFSFDKDILEDSIHVTLWNSGNLVFALANYQ